MAFSPLLIIMFGPPGSGKSSGLQWYITNVLSTTVPGHPAISRIRHLDLDNFVMQCNGYVRGKRGNENNAQFMSTLFERFIPEGREEFERQIGVDLNMGRSIAVDVVGRSNVEWLKKYAGACGRMRYGVHIVYPLVPSLNQLLGRLQDRFTATRQPAAPRQLVADALTDAPKNLRHVIQTFLVNIEQLTIYNNASTYHQKMVLFTYNPRQGMCTVLQHTKFKPCSFQL